MPDRRLTQLPVLAALSADDIFYVVDDPAGAANSRQVAASVFDARYLQAANNLSDLTNVVVARASLGLGTLATVNDAPADGTIYGRQNNAWAAASILPVVDETPIVYETGVPANTLTFDVTPYTAPRIVTWPDAALTVAGLEVANVFTVLNSFTTGIAIGSNPASAGGIRLQNNTNISWRNSINTGDVVGFRLDGTNNFFMASGAIYAWGGAGTTTLFVGNNDGNVAIGNAQTNPAGKLLVKQGSATGAKPVVIVQQVDVSEEFIKFIGTSANGVLTQSIVENADVGAATLQGWLKVFVQDDGNQLADQAYFVPIYTLA